MEDFKREAAEAAGRAGLPVEAASAAVTVPRERERADLSLPCFPFAKALKKAPPAIALEIAKAFRPGAYLEAAEAAGPFVNFRANRAGWTRRVLDAIAAGGADYGRSTAGRGLRVILEYGSPNIAKPLLFHHLRSAVIGQALVRLFRFAGYEVVALNFLGDVGTAFGKLMVGIEELGATDDPDRLNAIYVHASQACKADPAKMDRAREWAKRLEESDPEAVRVWTAARALSLRGFERIYDLLGVSFDRIDGEQMYVKEGARLVEELLRAGKARLSDGAVVLDPADLSLGVVLLRKSDGATLYHTRDVAAAIDRHARYDFHRMHYVVDVAQDLHFKQLFSALQALGHAWASRCHHVAFGQVLMEGSRARTREGKGVLLEEVLQEAQDRAAAIITEKNPGLPDLAPVARAVGVGAVIFSDLGSQIRRDVNFDFEQILSFDGRTGPYLQYAHASACSILRKGGGGARGDGALLVHDLEWQLVRRLAEFPAEALRACEACEPSVLADCLYDLAREFRAYHAAGGRDAALRVLCEDPATRAARLELVAAVRRVLASGLGLLGITAVEEM
ncbi:MAG: arginine--tRNA ligase [Planctomycetaceae bacterium]